MSNISADSRCPSPDLSVSPGEARPEAPQALCEECATLDFETIFNSMDAKFTSRIRDERSGTLSEYFKSMRQVGELVHSFGGRLKSRSEADTKCALCKFFRLLLPAEGDEHELRAFPITESHVFDSRRRVPHGSSYWEISRTAFLALVPRTLATNPKQATIGSNYKAIYRPYSGSEDDVVFRRGVWGRKLGATVDFKIISEWLDFCQSRHCITCNSHRPSPQRIRFVDCEAEPPVICTPSSTEKYFALSYVWGQKVSDCWPRVVEDAIEVTRKLGYRYLWVDRYCIDQGNSEEKHFMIRQMATIYEGADLTIVAAAGNDSSYGLPGVGSTRRQIQPKFHLQNPRVDLVAAFLDPRVTIQKSTWNSRGWTYQEAILSRRLVVFTDEQIYWECGRMSAEESLLIPLNLIHTGPETDWHYNESYMAPGIFRNAKHTVNLTAISSERSRPSIDSLYQAFDSHIHGYSKRSLTYESDTFDAIEGVFQRYIIYSESPVKLILGLPVLASECEDTWLSDQLSKIPDYYKAATPTGRAMELQRPSIPNPPYGTIIESWNKRFSTKRPAESAQASKVPDAHTPAVSVTGGVKLKRYPPLPFSFAKALARWNSASHTPGLWPQPSSSSRKKEFPSWTWAGWGGPLITSTIHRYGEVLEGDYARGSAWSPEMWLETSDGVPIDWREVARENLHTAGHLRIKNTYILDKLKLVATTRLDPSTTGPLARKLSIVPRLIEQLELDGMVAELGLNISMKPPVTEEILEEMVRAGWFRVCLVLLLSCPLAGGKTENTAFFIILRPVTEFNLGDLKERVGSLIVRFDAESGLSLQETIRAAPLRVVKRYKTWNVE